MSHPQQLLRTITDPSTGDTVPTTALTGDTAVMPQGYNTVVISFMQATDAAATTQLADNSTTGAVTVCHQRASVPDNGTAMTVQTPAPGHTIDGPLQATIPEGAEFSVYVGALSNPNASTERLNIYWQPIKL